MKERTPQPAKFVSFEGIDGCGKSTVMERLSEWLDEAGIPHIRTREPGGTTLGEKIRGLLLDPENKGMDWRTEVMLYTASRAQLVGEVIRPALKAGKWVLADRYIDATLAYQGYGRGLDLEPLRRMQDWAVDGLTPDATVLLDCDVELAFGRMRGRNERPDRMELESRAFHQKVRRGYLELAAAEPRRIIVLDVSRPLDEVIADFRAIYQERLQGA